jgi:predicted nucleic acid-binding protein
MAYLVDTDVLIDVAKGHPAAVDYVNGLQAPWSVSAITAMELLVGARDQRDVEKIDELLMTFPAVPLSSAIGTTAYHLLKQFSRADGLRVFDAIIAATAIEDSRTLVTRNRKHFRMISDLSLDVPEY